MRKKIKAPGFTPGSLFLILELRLIISRPNVKMQLFTHKFDPDPRQGL
jgi:hypothetical protein